MIARTVLTPDIRALAARQAGLLTVSQMNDHGVSCHVIQRLRAENVLAGVACGIYALEQSTWMQKVWTAVLVGGSRAVIGGAAAAYIHGLIAEQPTVIECFVGTQCRPRCAGPWRLIRSHRMGQGEPPITSIAQTIVDASRDMTADAIAAMVARGGLRVRQAEVLALLAETARHPNRRLVQDIVGTVSAGSQSALEVRYVRDVERAHRLPEAMKQANPTGHARVDNLYGDFGLIVEVDGRRYHQGLAASGDAARDNEHLLAGLATLRFSWREVSVTPCAVAAQVAEALRMAGWTGEFKSCKACPRH